MRLLPSSLPPFALYIPLFLHKHNIFLALTPTSKPQQTTPKLNLKAPNICLNIYNIYSITTSTTEYLQTCFPSLEDLSSPSTSRAMHGMDDLGRGKRRRGAGKKSLGLMGFGCRLWGMDSSPGLNDGVRRKRACRLKHISWRSSSRLFKFGKTRSGFWI